jgi:hypothetical protein
LRVLDGKDEVYVVRGRRVEHIDLRRDLPSRGAMRRLLLGPTGRLRAPTMRVGRIVVVGYDPQLFAELLARAAVR